MAFGSCPGDPAMNVPVGKVMTTPRLPRWGGHHFYLLKKDKEEEASQRKGTQRKQTSTSSSPRAHPPPAPRQYHPGPRAVQPLRRSREASSLFSSRNHSENKAKRECQVWTEETPERERFQPSFLPPSCLIFTELLSTLQSLAPMASPPGNPVPVLAVLNYQG